MTILKVTLEIILPQCLILLLRAQIVSKFLTPSRKNGNVINGGPLIPMYCVSSSTYYVHLVNAQDFSNNYVDEFVEQKESFIHAAFVIIPRDTSGP